MCMCVCVCVCVCVSRLSHNLGAINTEDHTVDMKMLQDEMFPLQDIAPLPYLISISDIEVT